MQFPVENVREVARVLVEANLGELTLERVASEGVPAARLSLKRAVVAPVVIEGVAEDVEMEPVAAAAPEVAHPVIVSASYVGIFRAAKTPVAVGTRVTKRQLVGIVESLHVPNEIYSPTEGVVAQVFVSDGQGVEWGQILMEIAPGSISDMQSTGWD